jgi:uncharacterized membrane protein YcaP (DUF421 family)
MATIIHAVIGYVLLALVVRVLTRRPGAQMTLFEFVLVFLMGGIIILSTVGNDRSVTNCTCAVIAVAMMHRLVSQLRLKYPRFGAWLDGTPLVLVRQGRIQEPMIQKMRLAPEDVMASARMNGLRAFEEIDYAVLERNGGISIIKKESNDAGRDE